MATSSNADSEIIAVTADTLLESAAVEPPPPLVESFNPLAPVITTGPRGTLADFLQRIREIRAISMNTVSGYLQSDRLYPSSDESKAMLQAKVMAAIATRALEFEGVPSAIESFEYRGRVVLMLYDLIERVGPPSLTAVPDGAEMAARKETSWRMPGTEIVIRRVADGSRKGEWLFSEETIQRLPEWERWAVHLPVENREAENFLTIYKYGPLGLHETVPLRWMLALPAWAKVLLADQPVWRWIGLLLLLGGSTLVFTLLRRGIRRIQKSSRVGVSAALWADVAVPGVLALLIIFIRDVAAQNLRFTEPVYAPLVLTLAGMLYLTLVWIIWSSGRAIAETAIVSRRLKARSIDGQLIRLTLRFFALILSVGVLVEGANRIGLPAYSIVTGLGVGGVAVALAARESLANLMGSFTIMIEKPFTVGHWIKVGDTEGTVEAVGFRSTRIRTFYDSLLSVPSSELMHSTIDNMGERKYRRVKTTFGISCATSPQRVQEFVEAVREIIATHPHTRKESYHVVLQDFADSSLEILLYFFLELPDWASELRQREDILLRIMGCAERLGIEFAFPTRTVHIAEQPQIG